MEKKGWRNLAIVFMALSFMLGITLIWAYNVGTEMIENESECAYNICLTGETYYYDEIQKICYCYQNNELVHSEYID